MYYEKNPTSDHTIKELSVTLLHQPFIFKTDSGVFSKNRIDYGSRVLLEAVTPKVGGRLLEIGCGYGAIGIPLAKVYQSQVTMVDVNERSLALCQENADRNHVSAEIMASDLYEAIDCTFDHIVSNPSIRAGKKVAQTIRRSTALPCGRWKANHCHPKKQGAPSAKAKMAAIFGNCEIIKKDKGYYSIKTL